MRLPAVEVHPLVRHAQISRIDRTESAAIAARAGAADAGGYKALMRKLQAARMQYEPPMLALEHRAGGDLREAIDDVMAKARENVARIKAIRKRRK